MGQDIGPENDAYNKGYNLWKSIGFFGGEEYLSFIFKKTEKIASALYVVSSLLKDAEPIKWELREKALDLLLSAIAANSSETSDKNAVIQSFFSDSLEIFSLLNMGFLSGLISEMNCGILRNELEAVVSVLKTKVFDDAAKAGYVLSDSFFRTDPSLLKTGLAPADPASREFFSETSRKLSMKAEEKNQSAGKQKRSNNTGDIKDKIALKDKKDTRKFAIIDLLKKKSHLTIKDFSQAIHGCSAKTIQRELLDLVAQGIVRKEGERRWSTYSLT